MGHKAKRTDASPIRKLIAKGISQSDLSREWGLGDGTVSNWLSSDNMPYYARVLCECMQRRMGKETGLVAYVIQFDAENIKDFEAMCQLLKAKADRILVSN